MKSSFMAYSAALAAVAVAVVVRLLFEPLLGDRLPFITLFLAVVVAAWYGGRGPAVLAFLVGAFAVAFFILEPRYTFAVHQIEYQVGLVLYGVVCIAAIAMFDSLHRARQRIDNKRKLLEKEVAARQAVEKVLAEREELLRITLGSIGDAVITTDAQGNLTYLNAVAQQLTGWTQDECKGKPLTQVFNIVNEQTRQPVENPVEKVLREGRVVGLANHTILINKDGTERAIGDSAAPIRDANGRVLGVVLVFHDISDRRQAEEALRVSQLAERERLAELDAILEATPTPIWIAHDAECRSVTGNPASYRLLGVSEGVNLSATPNQSVARPFQEYQDGKPVPPHELPMQRAAASGVEVRGVELSMVFDDGHVGHIFGNAAPIKNADGSVRGSVAAFMDITSLKEATQALQDADRRKDEFLATLSHELRNPLAPVRNSLELMKRASGNSDLMEQARCTMERQISQMVRLIDDLMDVSRITQNKLELKKERTELTSVIHHAVEANRPHCDAAGHELSVDLPSEPIYLNADPMRLAQVFGNLLANACKYTEPGGKIWLNVERQGSDVLVTVRDTGIGIPSDMLPKVFDMFTQVDRSLEKSAGGLGIGLSLVKRLVELHDGTVTANSEGEGRGSEFVVRLPVLTERAKAHEPPDMTSEPIQTTARRILVVDDNRDSARTLAMLLKFSGNETQLAHDGVEAVAKAAEFKPDVVLLDIGLPKMNGYDAGRAIREQPGNKDIAIVALTGWGQDEDRRKSKEAGFNGHLVKPVDHAALMKLLAELQLTPV